MIDVNKHPEKIEVVNHRKTKHSCWVNLLVIVNTLEV